MIDIGMQMVLKFFGVAFKRISTPVLYYFLPSPPLQWRLATWLRKTSAGIATFCFPLSRSQSGREILPWEREFLFVSKFSGKKSHRHLIPYPQDNNMIPRSISSKELWRVNPAQTIELLRPSLITRKNSEKLFFQNLVYTTNCAKQ